MTKTLVKHGNSFALIIDKPILDLLNIKEDTQLSVTTDGKSIVVGPEDPQRRKKVEAASKKIMAEWKGVFKKLAE
jgi:antitoxin MazE